MAKRFDQLSVASKLVVLDLFCRNNTYQDTIATYDTSVVPPKMTLVPNPETKAQFATRLCQEWIVQRALAQRAQDQAAAGQSDADLA